MRLFARNRTLALAALLALVAGAAPLRAQSARVPPPEILAAIEDDDLEPLPRGLAPGERVPSAPGLLAPTAPPSGRVATPAEYDRNLGLLIRWGSFNSILTAMTVAVTTGDPEARVWIVVSGAAQQQSATTTLTGAGAAMAQVSFLIAPTDSVWIRDYGPRFITEDGAAASVDHVYNRPRPNDDAIPDAVAAAWGHVDYDLPLVHGGGNFHLFGDGRAFMTDLVLDENPALSEAEVEQLFADYQALDLTIWPGFPTSYDSTQHIDMWLLPASDRRVIVGEYAAGQGGGVPRTITEDAAAELVALGYTVYRTPGWRSPNTHYTYTNAVILNRLVLVPQYSGFTTQNQQALDVFAQAFPGSQIVPIDGTSIVGSAGVFHCIVMHVPDPGFLFWDHFETGTTENWAAVEP